MPAVSVVIATKNREDILRAVSLASLALQDDPSLFEVVVWDASDNDMSRRVVEEFAAANPTVAVRHFVAPRVGLCRQRNDAVKEVRGAVVFFIDDDSEVSPGGIRALAEMFAEDPSVAGGCLPLDYRFPDGTLPANMRIKGKLAPVVGLYYKIFEPAKKASGYYPPVSPKRGAVDSLFGCDMAYRRELFTDHRFEERLQRFGNYVICDDQIFSRVLIMEGRKLQVAADGFVVHHAATGGRFQYGYDTGRVEGYNAGLVWLTAAYPWGKWTILPFVWARLGMLSAIVLGCVRHPLGRSQWGRLRGYLAGLSIFFREEFFRRA